MSSFLDAPWFYWALAVAVGLPVGVVLFTELQQALERRGSALARPVGMIRSYLLPLGALLALLVKANQVSAEATPVRIVATVFGFAVLILVLAGFNATLFQAAPEGSWRRRMPSIFLDVARFVLIAVGLALILSRVWGANVGGLFTALGITSIVLGLTLQNSVGQIISGLFVLFEQPFQLGDWIETPSARGRVVEVNWRATHIRTGSGLQIMPNSVLSAASFTNLSRPKGAHEISVDTMFAVGDPPDQVCALLTRVAAALPHRRTDAAPRSVAVGGTGYTTTIPLRSPADDGAARAAFLRWLWYAARRAGVHLDEADDDFVTADRIEAALRVMAPALRLAADDQEQLRPQVRITRYGVDETLQSPGEVPDQLTCLVDGQVQLAVSSDDGAVIPVHTLSVGDCLGQTTLTREPVTTTARALTETTVAHIDRGALEELVRRKPLLLQDIGRTIEEQREGVQRALA
ncbi:mechanosensitive ion channel domain-containing protein [Mycobacterium sp. pUA109]|uniref:mechanosensitive ion channel domain-containing protein n=1 Tax=Mycobacterium sp. pUA109 TaxID=3238982 RepID=UPI00351B5EF1